MIMVACSTCMGRGRHPLTWHTLPPDPYGGILFCSAAGHPENQVVLVHGVSNGKVQGSSDDDAAAHAGAGARGAVRRATNSA